MKNTKTERPVVLTTHTLPTPARKPDTARLAVIITTKDVKGKK